MKIISKTRLWVIFSISVISLLVLGLCFNVLPYSLFSEKPSLLVFHDFNKASRLEYFDTLAARYSREYDCSVIIRSSAGSSDNISNINDLFFKYGADIALVEFDLVRELHKNRVIRTFHLDSINPGRYLSPAINGFRKNDKLIALPWLCNTYLLFLNNEITGIKQDDAIDFETIAEAAANSNIPDSIYGFGVVGHDQSVMYKLYLSLAMAMGADLIDSTGSFNINSPQSIEALNYLCNISMSGIVETRSFINQAFLRGRLAMCFSDSELLSALNKSGSDSSLSTRMIPGKNMDNKSSFLSGLAWVINSSSRNSVDARHFLWYLSDFGIQSEFIDSFSDLGAPADTTLWQSFRSEIHGSNPFLSQLNNSSPIPDVLSKKIIGHINKSVKDALFARESAWQAVKNINEASKRIKSSKQH